ncbi:hypothetical protein ABPG72_013407 [Tetrahymena utriculariae]
MFQREYNINEPNIKNGEEIPESYKKELNDFYDKLFKDITQNYKKYTKLSNEVDHLYNKYKKIVHNAFFILNRNVTWNFSILFKILKCHQLKNKLFTSDNFNWNQSYSKEVKLTLRIVKQRDENKNNPASRIGDFIILHFFDKKTLEKSNISINNPIHQQDNIYNYTYQQKPQKKQTNQQKYDSKINKKNEQQMNQIQQTNQEQIINQGYGSAQKPNCIPQQPLLNGNQYQNQLSSASIIDPKIEENLNQNPLNKEGIKNNILEPYQQYVNFVKQEYVQLSDEKKVQQLEKQLEQQILQRQRQEQIYQFRLLQQKKEILKMQEEQFFNKNPNFYVQGLDETNPISLD